MENHSYKNEIIFEYEINDIYSDILLYNYVNQAKLEHSLNNRFKAVKPGIYTIKLKFKNPMNTIRKLFYNCENLIYVYLTNFDSNYLLDISFLFSKCINLKEIKGLDKLNTKKLIEMQDLIYGLNNFNTSNVQNMPNMFAHCKNLKEIKGLNNFNTSNIFTLYVCFLHVVNYHI